MTVHAHPLANSVYITPALISPHFSTNSYTKVDWSEAQPSDLLV